MVGHAVGVVGGFSLSACIISNPVYELRLNHTGKWSVGLVLSFLVLSCISHRNSYTRMENMMDTVANGKYKPSIPTVVETMKSVGTDSPSLAPHIAYRQVLLLALVGKKEESAALMKQSLKMYPVHAESLLVKYLQAAPLAIQQKTAYLQEMVKANARP
jgi:hypothetical protein